MTVKSISERDAIAWITDTVAQAEPGTAPFAFVLGAGFSAGLVPTVKELLRDYLPARGRGRSAGSHAEHMAKPAAEREAIARDYWQKFSKNNSDALKANDLYFELGADGLPTDNARAYQAVFDHRLSGGLNEPKHARQFLRSIMRLEQPRLNTGHFFLASMLGELRVLEDRRNEDGSYDSRFDAGVALSRFILTTNFDPFLQTALQFVGRPYYVSDRPELELDDLGLDAGSSAVHLVYVHGSIHRRSQISNDGDIQKIKQKNAQLLRSVLRTHGVIVLGYSGWDDAVVEALAAPGDRDHRLFWCGLDPEPLKSSSFGRRVPEILHQPLSFYVPIQDAGAFVFRLCHELIGLPRLLTSPVRELRDRLDSVDLAKVAVSTALANDAIAAAPPRTIEQVLAQTRAGLARVISTWDGLGGLPPTETGASVDSLGAALAVDASSPAAEAPEPTLPKRESVATTVVRPGDSLADVVRAAAPGTRISIAPGTYEASLVIDKELELEGQGDPAAVRIVSAHARALISSAERGRVAGLTLRQRGGTPWERQCAVEIRAGQLLLENCVIKSDGFAGIAVRGESANPTIVDCHIRDCQGSGVLLRERARATLRRNYISHNQLHGVVIQDGSRPELTGNQIHHNGRVGILVEQAGRGRVEANDIFANSLEGVTILGESAPELVRNNIYENSKAGVYVFDNGKGQLLANVIRSNEQSGVAIRTGADPVVRDNQINFNNGKGVWCSDGAAGTVEGNDLDDNRFGPFWKSDNSSTAFSEKKV